MSVSATRSCSPASSSSATNLLSFYRGDDKYSRHSLEGDLEKLRSYYMDRGYADFEITSTQVAMAPEKDDLFITVNVFEGTTWKMGAVKLAGRFVVPEEVLRQYVIVRPGDMYSQRLIAATEEALRNRLSEAGFGFADVAAVPSADPDDARNRAHLPDRAECAHLRAAHRISRASSRPATRSCGARCASSRARVLSNAALTRSEERLQRLPYIDKGGDRDAHACRAPPISSTSSSRSKRARRRRLGGGIGYSERQSFMLSGNFIDSNLFGSGDRLALDLNGGKYGQVFSVAHTDPYFTVDGVSRSLNASYVERDRHHLVVLAVQHPDL